MNHSERELDFFRRQLKAVIPPWPDNELNRDLWPHMLHRMREAPLRFGWFESVLVGLIVLSATLFPSLIPMMLLLL
jgi:hypothetical protein